jgi:hypothetical protein
MILLDILLYLIIDICMFQGNDNKYIFCALLETACDYKVERVQAFLENRFRRDGCYITMCRMLDFDDGEQLVKKYHSFLEMMYSEEGKFVLSAKLANNGQFQKSFLPIEQGDIDRNTDDISRLVNNWKICRQHNTPLDCARVTIEEYNRLKNESDAKDAVIQSHTLLNENLKRQLELKKEASTSALTTRNSELERSNNVMADSIARLNRQLELKVASREMQDENRILKMKVTQLENEKKKMQEKLGQYSGFVETFRARVQEIPMYVSLFYYFICLEYVFLYILQ